MSFDYTYAVARLRAVEAGMPDGPWFLRMARTPSHQLLAGVREHFPGFEGIGELHEFETGIESGTVSLYGMLSSVIDDRRSIEFLLAGPDFDNYVLALKGRMLGEKPVLLPYGLTGTELIEAAAESGDAVMLPDHLKFLHGRLEGLAGGDSPSSLEREGERSKWEFLLRAAPSEGAVRWSRLRIDRNNIKSFMRLRSTGLAVETTESLWIGGGTIEPSRYEALLSEPIDEFLSFITFTQWRGLQARGFGSDPDAWKIDAFLGGAFLELIDHSRTRFFDIMPVLYHMELVQRNESMLRIIFTGRINNLPDDDIEESVGALLS